MSSLGTEHGGRGERFLDDPVLAWGQAPIEGLGEAALAEGWLRLHYQPIVDLLTREVVGHEALVRVHHPDAGIFLPADFLMMERDPQTTTRLGRWVLEAAVARTARRWHAGVETYVAANVASAQLETGDFADIVRDALARHGLPPRALHLELNESTDLLPDPRGRAEVLRLHALGCPIWLDDFGVGFSSFAYVRLLPLAGLKLDRSFVSEVQEVAASTAVIDATLMLARSLDLSLVAEGVETERQAAALSAMGCEAGQGYLFGRPEPEDDGLEPMVGVLDARPVQYAQG